MKLISYILPSYNVSGFIKICLNSLVMQDMLPNEYEIVVVNDGSTDNTEQEVKDFQFAHPDIDIKIVTKNNEGVSAARNDGLAVAEGKYCWFVDPDDFIRPYSVGVLKPYILMKDIHIFYLDALSVSELTDINECPSDKINITHSFKKKNKHCGPWTVIINTDFLRRNKIQFSPDLAYGEDWLWRYEIKQKMDECCVHYINGYIYYYRQRSGGGRRNGKE